MSKQVGIINNCVINQRTGGGVLVGRCWHTLYQAKVCPIHGDISDAIKHFKKTGELTKERLK